MSNTPIFAVVGHPNKGKSSIVATLSQNDAIAIALEPGTTRARHAYPLKVDGKVLYTLVDTPGFQRPRRVLEWLEAHSVSASDHSETLKAFVVQHLALINSIGSDDYSDAWQSALGQFFQVVRKFDAVHAPFAQHLSLLRAFGQLEQAWEGTLETATEHLLKQREQRQSQSAVMIGDALSDMMSFQEKRTFAAYEKLDEKDTELSKALSKKWYEHQRAREQKLRVSIERLYQHNTIEREEETLNWSSEHDLFSQDSRSDWAVSKRYLATAGFGAGALGGVGIDALTFGASFGTVALVSGVIGAAGSYYYGGKLLEPVLKIAKLKDGLQTATFGPVQDSQFAYVVLGRAVDHWYHISQRNHAGRETLSLKNNEGHWIDGLSKESRRSIQKALDKCRKQEPLEASLQKRFYAALEECLVVFEKWRAK